MSAIFLPRRWRHQPQGAVEVDWSNPLARDLEVFCFGHDQFKPAAKSYIDNGTISAALSPEGASLEFSSGSWRKADNWISNVGRYNGSIVVCATPLADVSGNRGTYIAAARDGSSGSTRVYLRRLSGNVVGFGINGNASVSLPESTAWPTGTRGITALSWSASNTSAFFDGRQLYSDSALTAAPTYFNINSVVINNYTEADFAGLVLFHFVGVWSRPLLPTEQRELAQAPYQLFRAPSHRIWFDVGAGVRIPTLSLPGVTNITTTSVRPKVTLTF